MMASTVKNGIDRLRNGNQHRRRRWAHAPVIQAASHFDHKKRAAWVPNSMHTWGFYNYGAPLAARRSSIFHCSF